MNKRIHLLDELRGLCVVLMVVFHGFYTVGFIFELEAATRLFAFFRPVEPLFAGIFILLCGFSCRLSRSNLKRGLLLLTVAAGMSLVLYVVMRDQMIWFGVLHCLAVCILLFAATKPLLDRVPPLVGIVVCAVLFAVLWHFPFSEGGYIGVGGWRWEWPAAWGDNAWFLAFGIGNFRLYGSDYFPLFPWLFCFVAGTFLGQYRERLPAWCYTVHAKPLAFLGRHSLVIYLAHQPIIYGVCYVLSALL